MKVHVDQDKCQGHTVCAMTAPELFVLSDDDGHSSAIHEDVPPELEVVARKAFNGCPEQAIVLS